MAATSHDPSKTPRLCPSMVFASACLFTGVLVCPPFQKNKNRGMTMPPVKKSRATLIGVVLAFLIPVIGAKLVLDQNWYQGAVTNKGTMLVPPVELNELATSLPEGWRVALLDDGSCTDACIQGLYAMNQLDVALGKETG